MKLLPFIVLSLLMVGSVNAASYYFSNSGDDTTGDGSEGNPYATITKLNTISLNPGDNVYFARGSTWRLTTDAYPVLTSGNSVGRITYTNYGSGALPLFLGSYNLSGTSDWEVHSGNVWKTTGTYSLDIGNLIISGGISNGLKQSTLAAVNSAYEFFKNETDDKIYFYSSGGNPGTVYSSIEAAYKTTMFNIGNKDYLVFDGLDLRYGGLHGFESSNVASYITISDCSVSWIGGSYQTGTTRYGNGIEIGLGSNNINITRNNVSHCFDACLTAQSWLSGGTTTIRDHSWTYNIASYCSYGWEYFSSDSSSTVTNIDVSHNTFYMMGKNGFGTNDGRIRLSRTPTGTSGYSFTNNIIYGATYRGLVVGESSGYWPASIDSDYNLYYNITGASYFLVNGTNYASIAALYASTGLEEHGVYEDPLLDEDYVPAYNSPACTLSSTGGYVGALPCAEEEAASCLGYRGIYCDQSGCSYGGVSCSESSAYRTGTITCNTGGCS